VFRGQGTKPDGQKVDLHAHYRSEAPAECSALEHQWQVADLPPDILVIVYGDPQFKAPAGDVFACLRNRLRRVRADDLEALRPVLIQAGQLEQALADATLAPDAGAREWAGVFVGLPPRE
jgi:hypothetical protein